MEEKQETTQTEQTTEAPKREDDTVSIRKGELAGLKKQIAESRKALEQIAASKEAEEAEKARKAQDFAAVEKTYADKLAAANSELAATKRSVIVERARGALRDAGMRPGLAIDGAVASLPSEFEADSVLAWVDEIRSKHPSEFGSVSNPVGAPSAGTVSRSAGDEASQIKADWQKALKTSPVAAKEVKARIDEYMRLHPGKNPLV
jgi:hypothetical protein